MTTMTDSRAVEVLAEMREDGGTVAEADYTAAIDHAIARLREPAGVDLHDRVEFALRDAGFDYDVASRIARLAQQPAAVTQPAGGDVSNGSQQPAAVDGACGDACAHIAIERDTLKANTERLAEALRGMVENACAACDVLPNGTHRIDATEQEWDAHVAATDKAIAALHPTASQGGK